MASHSILTPRHFKRTAVDETDLAPWMHRAPFYRQSVHDYVIERERQKFFSIQVIGIMALAAYVYYNYGG